MIERKIVDENLQEYLIQEFITETLNRVGHSHTVVHKTPIGEKIIIHASRPGLIVGAKGSNIKKLTKMLKTKFKLENPQIEIVEIKDMYTNANLIAENIASQLERFGSQRFKALGYKAMEGAVRGGAMGVEILISGKIPSSRAKTWRFYMGYLKKTGDLAVSAVQTSYTQAHLKTGAIGIQVRVMPGTVILPDKVEILSEVQSEVEEVTGKEEEQAKEQMEESKVESEKVAEEKVEETKAEAPEKKAESQ